MTLHPQYVTDSNGRAVSVLLPMKEFKSILEELEELEDIKLYDKAKKNDDGVRIPMDEAFCY
jgi:PHD/YefM family antitoxin component YafN of YafNO toxin-antitoxin module